MKQIFIITGLVLMLGSGLTAQVITTKKVTIEKKPVSTVTLNARENGVQKNNNTRSRKMVKKSIVVDRIKTPTITRKF